MSERPEPTVFENANQHVAITVIGYEFPELDDAQHDSNWLIIQIDVIHPDGDWIKQYPCMLTIEVVELIGWLKSIIHQEPVELSIRFIEPNIWFKLDESCDGSINLTICLDAEFLPPWINHDQRDEGFTIAISLTDDELQGVIHSLDEQVKAFPPRSGFANFKMGG